MYTEEYVFIYILDFSLALVMIETEQGNKVWSSSISCENENSPAKHHHPPISTFEWCRNTRS